MTTIDEAKKKVKMFGDMFETEPAETKTAFVFYLKEQEFDLDEDEEDALNDDKPLVIVYKDTGRAELTCFFQLDNDIQLELINP